MNAWYGVCAAAAAAAVGAIPHAGGRTSAIPLAGGRTSFTCLVTEVFKYNNINIKKTVGTSSTYVPYGHPLLCVLKSKKQHWD
jgi:hypothetical protein